MHAVSSHLIEEMFSLSVFHKIQWSNRRAKCFWNARNAESILVAHRSIRWHIRYINPSRLGANVTSKQSRGNWITCLVRPTGQQDAAPMTRLRSLQARAWSRISSTYSQLQTNLDTAASNYVDLHFRRGEVGSPRIHQATSCKCFYLFTERSPLWTTTLVVASNTLEARPLGACQSVNSARSWPMGWEALLGLAFLLPIVDNHFSLVAVSNTLEARPLALAKRWIRPDLDLRMGSATGLGFSSLCEFRFSPIHASIYLFQWVLCVCVCVCANSSLCALL